MKALPPISIGMETLSSLSIGMKTLSSVSMDMGALPQLWSSLFFFFSLNGVSLNNDKVRNRKYVQRNMNRTGSYPVSNPNA
jgi:hypothetical protein